MLNPQDIALSLDTEETAYGYGVWGMGYVGLLVRFVEQNYVGKIFIVEVGWDAIIII
jgi:hypothetical protein